mgnify:FL=1
MSTQKSIYQNSSLILSAGDQFYSHLGGGVIDICMNNSEGFKAPFDCTLVSKEGDSGNTYVFVSQNAINVPGRSAASYVSFRCTHMNTSNSFHSQTYVGQNFSQGSICYYQGNAGEATGNHIHLQFALGAAIARSNGSYLTDLIDSEYLIGSNSSAKCKLINVNNTDNIYNKRAVLLPWEAMYLTTTTTVQMWDGDLDYKADYLWTRTNFNRFTKRGVLLQNNELQAYISAIGVYLRESPSTSANAIVFKNVGSYITVDNITTTPDTSGFTWAKCTYNGGDAFFQLDTNYYILFGNNTAIGHKMVLSGSSAWLRNCPRGNKARTTLIPRYTTVTILDFLGYTAIDGYRWVKVQYDGIIGYIQYDPSVMYVIGTY